MKLLYQDHSGIVFHRKRDFDYISHFHSAVEISFFLEGTCTVLHGKEHTELHGGDVFVAFPNQIHGYENSRDMEGYLLIVPVRVCQERDRSTLMTSQPTVPYLKAGSWESEGIFALLEMARQDKDRSESAVMQGYVRLIVSKLLTMLPLEGVATGGDEALRMVLRYLNSHYTETLTRKQIAQAAGYNESYISHIFSKTLKTTIPEYINSLRILDAKEQLRSTKLPVTRIATDLGFGSIRNFNRVFQKETGMTPSAYRTAKQD